MVVVVVVLDFLRFWGGLDESESLLLSLMAMTSGVLGWWLEVTSWTEAEVSESSDSDSDSIMRRFMPRLGILNNSE